MTQTAGGKASTVLLYAQDGKGMGHITRCLTIARHLVAAHPAIGVYIVTESPVIGEFELPERCDWVKLPIRLGPRGPVGGEEDDAIDRRYRELRAHLLREAALGLVPDLVLVDHEPLGHKGEFRDGLWALKGKCPETKFVFGFRDIMDGPERIRAQWRDLGAYEAFEHLYDGIAVYGSRSLYDVAEAYTLPPSVRSKLHYCGFIVRDPPLATPDGVRKQYGLPEDGPLVVATVGSGTDGFPVLEAVQAALDRLEPNHPNVRAILVTGPFMPPEYQRKLQAPAGSSRRVVCRADNFQLMQNADVIVSMGGYNSVCEALLAAKPLVIVPRATHKIEQQIRAGTLAAKGLAREVHPRDLSGEQLADAMDWALRQDRQAHARLVRKFIPTFDGAARLTEYLDRWLAPSRVRQAETMDAVVSAEESA